MFGNKLREARVNKGMTLDEVAETYNRKYDGKLNKSTLSRYENGLQEPMISVVQKLASVLDVSVDFLLDKESFERADVTYYKVIGSIAAGYGQEPVMEYSGEVIPVPSEYVKGGEDEYFVLSVSGKSMWPKILPNDKVLCRKTSSVDSGSTAVILYNGNTTLKEVRYETNGDYFDMIPANPEYETVRIQGEEINAQSCRILGQVIKLIRDV